MKRRKRRETKNARMEREGGGRGGGSVNIILLAMIKLTVHTKNTTSAKGKYYYHQLTLARTLRLR